jgi:fructose-specific PTS system IIA-like component
MPVEFEFACPLGAGLHARPASLLSEMANSLACECVLTNLRTGATANLKSTLAIIGADVRSGDECRITLSGDSEQQALATIRRWVEGRLPSVDESLVQPAGPKRTAKLPRALQDSGCTYFAGTAVSAGIGSGLVVYAGRAAWPVADHPREFVNPALERERITLAIAVVANRIGSLLARAKSKTESAILNAHLAILRDVSLTGRVHENISQGEPADLAVVHATEYFRDVLRGSASVYIRERALDLQDVASRLIEELGGVSVRNHALTLTQPSVIFAESLTPQELLNLNREHVSGLILEYAGTTSHTVILARSLGIPTLAGVPGASVELADGECVIVDATRGFVIKSDAPAVQRFYAREFDTQRRRQARLGRAASASAKTVDGRRLEVGANVSSPVEIRAAFESGADGVGVFRTEMLFVDRDTAPTEEEQFEIYAEAARAAVGRPVIIRTLDIGGDKRVPHLNLPHEPNPFLGYRGARIYPEHVEIFRSQVRAILRASAFGRVQIMLPMISSADEVRWAREQVEQVRQALQAAGTSIADVPLGIMIEVPSVAYALAEMSGVADFFSIGTNDLSQYFFAADRGNAQVWPLANSIQPAFLRFLKQIVDEARARRKWIGICGEMGGELKLLPLMLGLGFDEISAAVPNIPALKHGVSRLRQADCEKLLAEAMACHSAEEVGALLERAQSTAEPLPLLAREMVIIQSDSNNKEEAIRELVDTLYVAGRTDDRQQLEDAVWAREEVYSTALGFGFAVPHCKIDAVRADSIAVVKLASPIAWGAEESGGVDFAILLAMRESAKDNTHMQVFSRLARKLMNEEFRARFAAAGDADAVLELLMTVDGN